MYLFVALFSSQLHHHNGESSTQIQVSKNGEKHFQRDLKKSIRGLSGMSFSGDRQHFGSGRICFSV
jgi:hypothetical protein